MNIYPFDKIVEDKLTPVDVSKIQSDGITIRSGNRVIKLAFAGEEIIDNENDIKKELEAKLSESYKKAHNDIIEKFNEYREQLKVAYYKEKRKLEDSQMELSRRMSQVSKLPNITQIHINQGLSVAISDRFTGGLVWNFKSVYAPKFVNENRIDPNFGKKMITPISIEVHTNQENCVVSLRVNQIMGGVKFAHYHGMSNSSDCWGNFKYSGRKIKTPEEMILFCQEASFILETVNRFSVATRNPKGLPRLATLEKNVVKGEVQELDDKKALNIRNQRLGVTTDANQEVSENVWSV